jgi:phage-related protein (TIGR01555 family)
MLDRVKSWLINKLSRPTAPSVPAVTAKPKRPMYISAALLERTAQAMRAENPQTFVTYKAPDLPPNVRPDKPPAGVKLAHDEMPAMALDSSAPVFGWLNQYSQFGCGLFFPGYPYLAELTQISEYRAPSETTSTEMTRKWLEHVSKSGGDKSEKIAQIDARMKELKVRELFERAALLDGEFGRAQIMLNIKGQDSDEARQLPLDLSPAGIKKGSLVSLACIEPYWSTPFSWNAMYPERADFYKPQSWYIMGRKTHSSRLLTFIGREVPDLLKPAYNFGGISLSQLMQPYVNMWLRTRKAVNDLVNNFSITMLATNMAATLEEGQSVDSPTGLLARLALFTQSRNNQGVGAIDKDSEEILQVNTPLSGLSELQAQSQEHMAAPGHIPLIKMFGVTPTGLNATGEGEIKVWYDWIAAFQAKFFGPHYDVLLKAVQLDLFGAIDDDIAYQWVPLDEPTQKELAEIRKSDADAGTAYINAGVISPDEERERLQDDPQSGYNNLSGPAPEPEEPEGDIETDPSDLAAQGNEHASTEAEKQRQHEAEQAELDRKHEAALAKAKT